MSYIQVSLILIDIISSLLPAVWFIVTIITLSSPCLPSVRTGNTIILYVDDKSNELSSNEVSVMFVMITGKRGVVNDVEVDIN